MIVVPRGNGPTGISRIASLPLRGMIWIYQKALSPFFGVNCRFQPSCSAYAEEALRLHGAFKGSWLAVKRISRCHPWGESGYDPVPPLPDKGKPGEAD